MDATVVARDRVNDLALLKTSLEDPTTLPISSSNPVLPQDIYAAGFPFGSSISASVKVTKGIVSSLSGVADNFSNVQIDAALQPGSRPEYREAVISHYSNEAYQLRLDNMSTDQAAALEEQINQCMKVGLRAILKSSEVSSLRSSVSNEGASVGSHEIKPGRSWKEIQAEQ